ncbi:hypothetical protein BV22DRAFT_618030 [Leucogyrophana mollusca]|uniref:Uncharacterized protein n=1 Tax=Leucogyrophana mollusca TaxID=85980 RepID=A0ACB8BCE8_9AGAM|nr:hypothetical protein BV22DRAFT_618030 [Leucogyrophana mollusca]
MLHARDTSETSEINYEVINQPMLICTFVAILLFGVTSTQTFYYFHRFPSDGYMIRATVAAIWLFEALHSALLVDAVNHSLIEKAGDVVALLYIYHGTSVSLFIPYLSHWCM